MAMQSVLRGFGTLVAIVTTLILVSSSLASADSANAPVSGSSSPPLPVSSATMSKIFVNGVQANPTKRCQENGTILSACVMEIQGFPGGTIAIDIDADGTGTGHWMLIRRLFNQRVCETDYDLFAPPQSWLCFNVPGDNYLLWNYVQPSTNWAENGARW